MQVIEDAASWAEVIRHYEKEISKANIALADWTQKLIASEKGLAEARGSFDKCVKRLHERKDD